MPKKTIVCPGCKKWKAVHKGNVFCKSCAEMFKPIPGVNYELVERPMIAGTQEFHPKKCQCEGCSKYWAKYGPRTKTYIPNVEVKESVLVKGYNEVDRHGVKILIFVWLLIFVGIVLDWGVTTPVVLKEEPKMINGSYVGFNNR